MVGVSSQDCPEAVSSQRTSTSDMPLAFNKSHKNDKSDKNKKGMIDISNKENLVETSEFHLNENAKAHIQKKKELSMISEFDSDKETSLTRKLSDISQDIRLNKSIVFESETKEQSKALNRKLSYTSIDETDQAVQPEKMKEEGNYEFDSSNERIIDYMCQGISRSNRVEDNSNQHPSQYFEDSLLRRHEDTREEQKISETSMQIEKECISPKTSHLSLKRPEISPEKEKENISSTKSQDFNKVKIVDLQSSQTIQNNTPSLFNKKPSITKENCVEGIQQQSKLEKFFATQNNSMKEYKPPKSAVENKKAFSSMKQETEQWDDTIRLDLIQIMKSYEDYAKSKVIIKGINQ